MPQNAQYYHAAYIIAAIVYGGYACTIWWRARDVRRRLAGANPASRAAPSNTSSS